MSHVKILFEHENAFEGGFGIEGIWAVRLGDGLFQIDNIPFYVKEYSFGDIVRADEKDGFLYATKLERSSGHSTVRILFANEDIIPETRTLLNQLGCESEVSNLDVLISVDIPPSVSYEEIKNILDKGEETEDWTYEEGCICH